MPAITWRTLQLPPGDRAFWRPPKATTGPLLYLAWGGRQFGSDPIATTLHDGWVYAMIEKGSPFFVRESGKEQLAAPALLIIGPDCASGWTDYPDRFSRLLVWMWRRPTHSALTRLNPAGCVRLSLCAGDQDLLGSLHAHTRREAQLDDADSSTALEGLQLVIETQLARLMKTDSDGAEGEIVDLAVQWLRQHLDSHQPLARLADYLGLSPSSVQRHFRQKLHKTVVQVITEMRCREAARMITEDGAPIKTVAYRLGYRHPHDFSRAYQRATGSCPSILSSRFAVDKCAVRPIE